VFKNPGVTGALILVAIIALYLALFMFRGVG